MTNGKEKERRRRKRRKKHLTLNWIYAIYISIQDYLDQCINDRIKLPLMLRKIHLRKSNADKHTRGHSITKKISIHIGQLDNILIAWPLVVLFSFVLTCFSFLYFFLLRSSSALNRLPFKRMLQLVAAVDRTDSFLIMILLFYCECAQARVQMADSDRTNDATEMRLLESSREYT